MDDLQRWLRDADPIALEPPLPGAEVARLRQRVLAAGGEPPISGLPWLTWPVTAAATVCVVLAAVLFRRDPDSAAMPGGPTGDRIAIESVGPPTQLHFSTPGGTRVIWLFNPEFEERR